MKCKYGAHVGAVELVHDAVSSVQNTYQCCTDEALAKRNIMGTLEPRLANVRHFFVFARQHREVANSSFLVAARRSEARQTLLAQDDR